MAGDPELLLQRAKSLGIAAATDAAMIDTLLEQEVDIPEADTETCRRYYTNNRKRYRSADLVEAAHILLPAAPADDAARERAEALANDLIEALEDGSPSGSASWPAGIRRANPRMPTAGWDKSPVAIRSPRWRPSCSISRTTSCVPCRSRPRYGVHIVRVDKQIRGRELPFETVADRIRDELTGTSWRQAFRQYVMILAGGAEIAGIDNRRCGHATGAIAGLLPDAAAAATGDGRAASAFALRWRRTAGGLWRAPGHSPQMVDAAPDRTFAIGAMADGDWKDVRAIYREGLATGLAAFMLNPPRRRDWDAGHLTVGRLVARSGEGRVLGWSALAPVPDT